MPDEPDQPAVDPTEPTIVPADTPDAQAEAPTPWWRRRWVIITAAVVLALIVIAAVAGGGDDDGVASASDSAAASEEAAPSSAPESAEPSAPTTTPAPTPEPTPTPAPTPGVAGFGPGTVVVGEDADPGTYRGEGGDLCYWERLSGFGGTLDEVIANDIGNAHPIVTIVETDAGFNSEGCGSWTADLSAITDDPAAAFGDGTYQIGVDISPGTWRAAGGDTCYWERLSGFAGTLDDVIANDIGSTDPVVTIDAADVGFGTEGCGDWTFAEG